MRCENHDHSDGCASCQAVVLRAYRELRERNVTDERAFWAAVHLYALRHPERERQAHIDTVATWLADDMEALV